jgi:hypothetical protein
MSESSVRPFPNVLKKAAATDQMVVAPIANNEKNESINQQCPYRVRNCFHFAMKICCSAGQLLRAISSSWSGASADTPIALDDMAVYRDRDIAPILSRSNVCTEVHAK